MPNYNRGRRCPGRDRQGAGWLQRGHRHGFGGVGGSGGYRDLSWFFGQDCSIRHPNYITYGYADLASDEEYDNLDYEVAGGQIVPGPTQQTANQDQIVRDVLKVENVDFRAVENARKHHTDEFDITECANPQLVVRRGQPFTISIRFSRAYDITKDDLHLVFEIGSLPLASKGTQVEFVLSDKDEPGHWGAKIDSKSADGRTLTITVFTPPTCAVGKWHLRVNVVKTSDTKTSVFSYNHKDPIYVLFNPWCKDDTVYMEKPDDLHAYVLKEEGKIYSGNCKKITPRPWVFGQFTGHVLDCCMYLLKLSEMDFNARGDPIRLVRKLTAMVNSQDEGGVLTGNWSGDYSEGKSPLSWTGSAPILEQFFREKTPVRFGQCWVFSGVLTTVCRALGIPARSVTNFASAHDADTSITIDLHFDIDGTPLNEYDQDSVWNFHVWNEVWMSRPDLPSGYGGWQACDATPQETSDGVYCCGPCPVRAIKEGEVNMNYDGPFIFAEVNADRIYWVRQQDGSWQNVYAEKKVIGKFISTLAKDSNAEDPREDITHLYKYPEDSPEERVAVHKANLVGSRRKDVYQIGPQDVEFKLKFDAENSFVGDEFTFQLHCKNTSTETRTVEGRCIANTMYYTGVVADQVAAQQVDLQLKPGESKMVEVRVPPEVYHSKLKDCSMLSLSAMARVSETQQIFTKKDDTRLRKPHLNIKAPSSVKMDKEMDVEVSFTNPLKKTLTDCYLEVELPGLGGPKRYPQGDVAGKGTFYTTIKLKPHKKGEKEIVAIFSAHELEDINGSHTVIVKD